MSLHFRKSSASNPYGDCLEAASADGRTVLVRDSKEAGQPVRAVHEYPADDWTAFVGLIVKGEFDVAGLRSRRHPINQCGSIGIAIISGDLIVMRHLGASMGPPDLWFTFAEWAAFLAGARHGEFAIARLVEPLAATRAG